VDLIVRESFAPREVEDLKGGHPSSESDHELLVDVVESCETKFLHGTGREWLEKKLGGTLTCEESDAGGIDVDAAREVERDEVRAVDEEEVGRRVGYHWESSEVDFAEKGAL